MHAYTNPAFCPAFVSRIPKPAPLHPPHKPGDPKQISAHFKRNPRSPRLPLEQSQHNPEDPKQPAGTPRPATRDPLHPLEELPSTSQMQPAVPAMPTGFEMSLKLHRLGAIQHAGQEDSDRPQQEAAELPPDDQQRPTSSSNLFHQPGHAVVSVVSEDAVQSSHQQEHAVGVLPADCAGDSTHALHAGPHTLKHVRAVQQEGEVDDWDEPSFGDMCRRLVAVTEVSQVAAAASLASALCHSSPCGSSCCSCSSRLCNSVWSAVDGLALELLTLYTVDQHAANYTFALFPAKQQHQAQRQPNQPPQPQDDHKGPGSSSSPFSVTAQCRANSTSVIFGACA